MALTLLAGIAAPLPASAAPDDPRAEARRLAAGIQDEGRKLSILAEQSDEATLHLAEVERQQAKAQRELDEARAAGEQVRARLSDTAIEIYQRGGIEMGAVGVGADTSSVAQGLLRRQYSMSFQARQADALDAMRAVTADLLRRQQRLEAERRAASEARAGLENARRDAEATQARLEGLLAQVQGDIAPLVEEEQVRLEEEEAQQVEQQRPEVPRTPPRPTAAPTTRPPAGQTAPAPTPAPKPAPRPEPPHAPAPNGGAEAAVAEARRQIGKPYRYGGSGPNDFDCSGLTAWAWRAGGRSLPHSSRAQYSVTSRVDPSQAQPGDLFFFGSPIHHVGIYVGNGTMVEASQTGRPVRYASVARRDLAGVGRVT